MNHKKITGSIQVCMCPNCNDVHLVVVDDKGVALFNAGFSDADWDTMFLSVAQLQKERNQVRVQ